MSRITTLVSVGRIWRSSTISTHSCRALSRAISNPPHTRTNGALNTLLNARCSSNYISSYSRSAAASSKVLAPQTNTWGGVNEFHTSPRREFHPLFWMLAKPVAKLATVITGRQFRKWWKELSREEKRKYAKKFGWKILAALGILGLFGLGNYFTHLQETPITKRKRYIAFTDEQFKKIVQYEVEMHMETYKDTIVDFNDPSYKRVQRVVQKIIKSNQDIEFLRKQVWKIIVIKSPEANAFVMPTGHIFIHTGILNLAQNDDQLAVVLGHEMSHAILGHGAENVSFAQILDVVVIVVMAGIWCFMPSDGIALVTQWFYNKCAQLMLHLPHSRAIEREADQVGLQLMAKACYDVRESSHFWNLMRLRTATENNSMEEMPEFLSTHPTNESRVVELEAQIPEACDLRKSCNCGRLPAKDPREGIAFLENMVRDGIAKRKQQEKQEREYGVAVVPVPAKSGA